MSNKKVIKLVTLIMGFFLFLLFFKITKWTPLAGDDWGYALNGMSENPFKLVYDFYMSWSGRIVSELWGFIVAPRKELWNVLNPLLFFFIYLFSVKIIHVKRSHILTGLILAVLMLNVSNNLRMETYTWIMGTTYVIPLFLSLIILYYAEETYIRKNRVGHEKRVCILLSVLCFLTGLTMENIAAVMVFAFVLIVGYLYYYEKKINVYALTNGIFGLLGFLIMRLSPGSRMRLLNDHALWNELGLLDKMSLRVPDFIQYSFLENKYLVLFLGVILCVYAFLNYSNFKKKSSLALLVGNGLINGIASISVFSNILIDRFHLDFFSFMQDAGSIWNLLFWILFTLNIFITCLVAITSQDTKEKVLFYLLLGGSSTVIMLVSPIFGARSALYFNYFAFIVIGILFNELKISNKVVIVILGIICVFLISRKTREYLDKYSKVNEIQEKRLSDIAYYIANPDIKEVHITRMPPLSVHGADIEIGDDYHFETFKQYYGLPMEDDIIFEFADSYD